ncbi:uncharacterized protein [Physcomitrium patens]|uniref:uncharacterized protein n=1 Tax=Physcomitrium patens TaxID=3218 RepID=UPI003CCE3563
MEASKQILRGGDWTWCGVYVTKRRRKGSLCACGLLQWDPTRIRNNLEAPLTRRWSESVCLKTVAHLKRDMRCFIRKLRTHHFAARIRLRFPPFWDDYDGKHFFVALCM